MAGKQLFNDESDEDSIATDSTQDSDAQSTYDVEKICFEQRSIDTGGMQYLVKWSGYPLAQCTWEPSENFESDSIMEEWVKQKQLIREGKAKPFSIDDFETAVENLLAAKEVRRQRRKAKRRKRGLSVSATESEGEVPLATQRPKPTPVKQPAVQRKGVAQKLGKRRAERSANAPSSSESSGSETESSGNDSMVEELKSKPLKRAPNPRDQPSGYKGTAVTSRDRHEQAAKPRPLTAQTVRPKQVVAPAAARKSAPSTVGVRKAKRTGKDLSKNWAAQKEGRSRQRVNGETPRGYEQERFTYLSQQNRFQKYGRNEGTPDLRALNLLDLRTGKVQPPKNSALSQAAAVEPRTTKQRASAVARAGVHASVQAPDVPTAYYRRTPPPEARQRILTPRSPEPAQATGVHTNTTHTRNDSNSASRPPGAHRWQEETCRYWLYGNCQHTKETCKYAHWYIQPVEHQPQAPAAPQRHLDRKEKTCPFWKKGHCRKSAEECGFAHVDTGVDARLPQSRAENQEELPAPPPRYIQQYMDRKDITCKFWKDGNCKKSEEECDFAHRDTGVDALPPGFLKQIYRKGTVLDGNSSGVQPVAHGSEAPVPFLQAPTLVNVASNNGSFAPGVGQATLRTDVNLANALNNGSPMQMTASPATFTHTEASPRSPPRAQHWSMPPSRRRSAQALTTKAGLQLLFKDGQSPSIFRVRLEIVDNSFSQHAENVPLLNVEHMIMASDVEHCLWNESLQAVNHATGGILADHSWPNELDTVTDLCKLHGCGLLASVQSSEAQVLIYPSNTEEWKFLDKGSIPLTVDSILRYRLFPHLPGLEDPRNGALQRIKEPLDMRSYVTILGEQITHLDREILLPKDKDIKDVFIMMPTTHMVELELYTKEFQSMGCKVYHSGSPGAWAYFRKKCRGKSLVVLHPDVPVWQIPGLHDLLFQSGALFFSLGIDRTAAFLEDQQPTFGCTRMFPHGTVVYITDDVLQYHPEKATAVIQNFLEMHQQKPEGADYSRVAARPGLKEFIEEKMLAATQRGGNEKKWADLYDAVCTLFPPDAEDPWHPGNPLPNANLISMSPDLLPTFDGLWETNESAATDFMVEWFAGWCAMNASRYRKFIVCHEPKSGGMQELDPLGWAKKYQHLGVLNAKAVTEQVFRSTRKKAHR